MDDEALQGCHILLVEDNEINRDVVKAQLQAVGIICEAANNGQEALDNFQASPTGYFDAILMDIRMSVMDGKEATRHLRQLSRSDAPTVPIIALTADAFEDARKEIMQCGMTTYLAKPVYPNELYAVIRNVLP